MNHIISIVVSSHYIYAKEFLKKYKLNPYMFLIVTEQEYFSGLNCNIPVIITYGESSERYNAMLDCIKQRFKSVRYIDY